MNVPLPFPYCSRCGRRGANTYHRSDDCKGMLEIDPENEEVRCSGCGAEWNIWNSKYYCGCGNVFEAKEVKDAVDEMLEDCRICAEELLLIEKAYWKRSKLANESRESLIVGVLEGLGYSTSKLTGYVISKLVEFIKGIFL